MKLSGTAIKHHCRKQGSSLVAMLSDAGVSRTAYYSLTRRDSVLPRSVHAMAHALGVNPTELLEEERIPTRVEAADLLEKANRVLSHYPNASFENIWHTLMLLRESPVERLNRSLRRGRNVVTDK